MKNAPNLYFGNHHYSWWLSIRFDFFFFRFDFFFVSIIFIFDSIFFLSIRFDSIQFWFDSIINRFKIESCQHWNWSSPEKCNGCRNGNKLELINGNISTGISYICFKIRWHGLDYGISRFANCTGGIPSKIILAGIS